MLHVVLCDFQTFLHWDKNLRVKVFKYFLPKRIFIPKRKEVTGVKRGASSPNVIRMLKLRKMRWVGLAVHIGDMRNA